MNKWSNTLTRLINMENRTETRYLKSFNLKAAYFILNITWPNPNNQITYRIGKERILLKI